MIKTYNILIEEYADYSDVDNKIARLVKSGNLIKFAKGYYETDSTTPGFFLAGTIYGPSYLSFDFALAYHNLIPETVFTFTSATFQKGKTKQYINDFGCFTYRDIPSSAFPYEVLIIQQNDYVLRIASAEKAICDKLYSLPPVANKKELNQLLFQDLRIDEEEFSHLNFSTIHELCGLYKSKNLNLLQKIVKGKKHEHNHSTNASSL